MIGVLLTSTCYYDGIEQDTFADRVEELVSSIKSLKEHIRVPYELIIADNSPPDKIPTEKILQFCPERSAFKRIPLVVCSWEDIIAAEPTRCSFVRLLLFQAVPLPV